MSPLDSFVFLPAMLREYLGASGAAPSTSLALGPQSSGRTLQLELPCVVRDLGMRRLGSKWNGFCALLRKHGLAIKSTQPDFESLPAVSMPARIGCRTIDEGLDEAELATADAFELDCRPTGRNAWSWPCEASTPSRLAALVESVRVAAGGSTPIGILLPLGVEEGDVKHCLSAGADFLTLVAANKLTFDTIALHGIRSARQTCVAQGHHDLPIVLDAPLENSRQMITCLALGASVVSLDRVLAPLLTDSPKPATTAGGGMLSGIARAPTAPDTLDRAAEMLVSFESDLRNQMLLSGARDLTQFNHQCLRAVSEDIARVSGVPLLNFKLS